jgi:hypothetical protein
VPAQDTKNFFVSRTPGPGMRKMIDSPQGTLKHWEGGTNILYN